MSYVTEVIEQTELKNPGQPQFMQTVKEVLSSLEPAIKKDEELVICGSNIDEFNGEKENVTGHRVVPEKIEEIYEFSKRRSAFNHPTVMYKKSKVLENGGYSNLRRNKLP